MFCHILILSLNINNKDLLILFRCEVRLTRCKWVIEIVPTIRRTKLGKKNLNYQAFCISKYKYNAHTNLCNLAGIILFYE